MSAAGSEPGTKARARASAAASEARISHHRAEKGTGRRSIATATIATGAYQSSANARSAGR
ncbi:MAG: hypothetical protein KatS3mg014_0902 [Actinomycetota bacterium]|nr:MAG: hypothetical protein KatS3mg014_0902 [Actinomycetota bacterium]